MNRRERDRRFYEEKYARLRSEAARKVERDVLGSDVGLSGYTTIEQAEALRRHLSPERDGRLLDLGAGRGWPGTYLARATGCRLVSTDIPRVALQGARSRYARHGLRQGSAAAIASDGRWLPFRPGSFDAVSHADVFC